MSYMQWEISKSRIQQGMNYIQSKNSRRRILQGASHMSCKSCRSRTLALHATKIKILQYVNHIQFKNRQCRISKVLNHLQCRNSKSRIQPCVQNSVKKTLKYLHFFLSQSNLQKFVRVPQQKSFLTKFYQSPQNFT